MTTDPMVSDLTARDFFAAAALEGLLAAVSRREILVGIEQATTALGYSSPAQLHAHMAYNLADAMLAERAKFYKEETMAERAHRASKEKE